VVTVCSAGRLTHVERQQAALRASGDDALRVLVWLDAERPPTVEEAPEFEGAIVLHAGPGPFGLRLAAGRNAGATAAIDAGAELLVFLDADCIPGPEVFSRYRDAASRHPDALLCGPVTYLPEGVIPSTAAQLRDVTAPHAARPAPADGAIETASDDDYRLFWSLSFAVGTTTWNRIGGFDPSYEGYGGEDTDFAFRARDAAVPLLWVGGAHAYHQYHPTSKPPWQHLDDILRNGRIFAERWGTWPMEGWLDAFAEAGAVRRTADGWTQVPRA
jgi:hypothetical protein